MDNTLLILIGAQICYTVGDFLARQNMSKQGFTANNFISWWFLIYLITKIVAITGQLYVFSRFELGKTMVLFGAVSIVLSAGLGYLLLKETLNVGTYLGISLAIIAFLIIALGK